MTALGDLSWPEAERRGDAVVAPAVGYGSSGEHAGFAGTISIGQQSTELVLLELGRSAEPATRLRTESRDVLLWMPGAARRRTFFPPVRFGAGPDAHAGRTETSIQLALHPGRVRTDRAEPGNPAPLTGLMPLLRSGGVRAASPNGVLGDPSGSTATEGAALLDALAADLLAEVATWRGEDQP